MWFNRHNFPYSDFHSLNLDWLLQEMTRLVKEWEQLKAEWEQMKIDWENFQKEMQRLWSEYQELMNRAWEAFKDQMEGEWEAYQDDLNTAWQNYQTNLNQQWTTYQNNLNAAWTAYQNTVNGRLDAQDANIAQLNSDWLAFKTWVENYLNNLDIESIITPIVRQWLDDHGVTISSTCVLADDYPTMREAVAASNSEKKPLWLSPGKTYDAGGYQLQIDNGLYGNGATIEDAGLLIKSSVHDLICDADTTFSILDHNDVIIIENVHAKSIIQNGQSGDTIVRGCYVSEGLRLRSNSLEGDHFLIDTVEFQPNVLCSIDCAKGSAVVRNIILDSGTATVEYGMSGTSNGTYFFSEIKSSITLTKIGSPTAYSTSYTSL